MKQNTEDLLNLKVDALSLKVFNSESKHREFKRKLSTDAKAIQKYAKTMASFANTDGGIIIFGIEDKPRKLIGDESSFEESLISNTLKSYFDPEIIFECGNHSIHSKKFTYIVVPEASNKPVICKKQSQDQELREGAIYYRYYGQTREIGYSELKSIIDEHAKKIFDSIIQNVTIIKKIGYEKSSIVDATNLSEDGNNATVFINNETAKHLNWIYKGRFSQSTENSDKAYYVKRTVTLKQGMSIDRPTSYSKTHTMTQTEMLRNLQIKNTQILRAIQWKHPKLMSEEFYVEDVHGKNSLHKFTPSALQEILFLYPLDTPDRKSILKRLKEEWEAAKKNP